MSVSITLYKEERSARGFNEILGELPEAEAEALLQSFNQPIAGRCISQFQIQAIYEHYEREDGPHKALREIRLSEIPSHGFMCHADAEKYPFDANANAYERIKYCHGRLVAGKCECTTMIGIIGKKLFPGLYK
ncbi:MAG: hypothetical protein LBG89_02780 [Rickettsiales bacterium]|jgi:hypothetical protein|nr:hypothetical protein [Rickettsiales bacterium]